MAAPPQRRPLERICAQADSPFHKRVVRLVCDFHAGVCDDCLGKCANCGLVLRVCPLCAKTPFCATKTCVRCARSRVCKACDVCAKCLP